LERKRVLYCLVDPLTATKTNPKFTPTL
jgi:hypothetical protein